MVNPRWRTFQQTSPYRETTLQVSNWYCCLRWQLYLFSYSTIFIWGWESNENLCQLRRPHGSLLVIRERNSLYTLGLVFICRENPRRSGILLFPDCPRFFRLMKTRNLRYSRSSWMDGDKSEESGVLFSGRVPDFCHGRRSFLTNENSNLYLRRRRRWISLNTNPLHCWAPVPYHK